MPFENLDAWKVSHALTVQLYQRSKLFPPEERDRLTDQLRRAASSSAANIAEGACRSTRKEFRRYLGIAIKSLNEVGYWLLLARDAEFISVEEWKDLDQQRNRAGKLCWFLQKSLE